MRTCEGADDSLAAPYGHLTRRPTIPSTGVHEEVYSKACKKEEMNLQNRVERVEQQTSAEGGVKFVVSFIT